MRVLRSEEEKEGDDFMLSVLSLDFHSRIITVAIRCILHSLSVSIGCTCYNVSNLIMMYSL